MGRRWSWLDQHPGAATGAGIRIQRPCGCDGDLDCAAVAWNNPTRASVYLGVGSPLANPKVELYDSAGAKIAENDDWPAALAPTFAGVGAFALSSGSRDAALVVTLTAGHAYTVQVSGVNGVTGEALVEVYELP